MYNSFAALNKPLAIWEILEINLSSDLGIIFMKETVWMRLGKGWLCGTWELVYTCGNVWMIKIKRTWLNLPVDHMYCTQKWVYGITQICFVQIFQPFLVMFRIIGYLKSNLFFRRHLDDILPNWHTKNEKAHRIFCHLYQNSTFSLRSFYGNLFSLKALFNNVSSFTNLRCMALRVISVCDMV